MWQGRSAARAGSAPLCSPRNTSLNFRNGLVNSVDMVAPSNVWVRQSPSLKTSLEMRSVSQVNLLIFGASDGVAFHALHWAQTHKCSPPRTSSHSSTHAQNASCSAGSSRCARCHFQWWSNGIHRPGLSAPNLFVCVIMTLECAVPVRRPRQLVANQPLR